MSDRMTCLGLTLKFWFTRFFGAFVSWSCVARFLYASFFGRFG